MNYKICTVIIGTTLKGFLKNLKEGQKSSSMVELRVDYIEDLTIGDIHTIRKNTTVKAIFTCRKQSEGGKFTGTEQARAQIIAKADSLQFDYIDLEYSSFKLSRFIRKSKIILSYHHFEKTPPLPVLQRRIKAMQKLKPSVIKLATFINNDTDTAALIKVLLEQKNQDMITIGMGKKGKWTRVLFPLLGSFCTFAALNTAQASAPGQMTAGEMKQLFTVLS